MGGLIHAERVALYLVNSTLASSTSQCQVFQQGTEGKFVASTACNQSLPLPFLPTVPFSSSSASVSLVPAQAEQWGEDAKSEASSPYTDTAPPIAEPLLPRVGGGGGVYAVDCPLVSATDTLFQDLHADSSGCSCRPLWMLLR